MKRISKARKRPDEDSKTIPQALNKPNGSFSEEASRLQMTVIEKHHLNEKLNQDVQNLSYSKGIYNRSLEGSGFNETN